MEATWAAMSSVALPVWVASDFTSLATTAKPLPASPARAASMVALSASRLVWLAMLLMSSTTVPICSAVARSSVTFLTTSSVCAIAPPETCEDSDAWRPISSIEAVSSWVAALTDWTVAEVWPDLAQHQFGLLVGLAGGLLERGRGVAPYPPWRRPAP